jgi:hypothetical protein
MEGSLGLHFLMKRFRCFQGWGLWKEYPELGPLAWLKSRLKRLNRNRMHMEASMDAWNPRHRMFKVVWGLRTPGTFDLERRNAVCVKQPLAQGSRGASQGDCRGPCGLALFQKVETPDACTNAHVGCRAEEKQNVLDIC